ncbi:MAG: PDDEXK nuclease domain-containing protein [Spirosomaceae bacterium]|nr:PDDEXK nuclease domain-containing protein [Spirosomataceae bacterium]
MDNTKLNINTSQLINDLLALIENARNQLAYSTNATLTMTYWHVGKRINTDILSNKRADYGKQTIISVSQFLVSKYGKSYEEKNLRRMVQFAQVFDDETIVVSLIRQLSWTHFIALIPIKNEVEREFYTQMCKIEGWNVKTLRQKIEGMLFKRTAISKKPEELIQHELQELNNTGQLTPDLVFKNPYFLDFVGLKANYSEKSLEDAILRELEYFILELGNGFTFVERQKRMIIDGEDFYLDLLFYHRKLKRLVAVELKLGKFKAAYKGQMELYLRWLEKYDKEQDEEPPIGLILCAEGNTEQIELLKLENSGIKVAEYLTELPDLVLLKQKLHLAIEHSRNRLSKN